MSGNVNTATRGVRPAGMSTAQARGAYLKGGSPSCDKEGVTGEVLKRAGIRVIRVP